MWHRFLHRKERSLYVYLEIFVKMRLGYLFKRDKRTPTCIRDQHVQVAFLLSDRGKQVM